MQPGRRAAARGCWLLAALAGGVVCAQPQLLLEDGFGDGDRDNDGVLEGAVTDAADAGAAWYAGNPLTDVTVSIENDGAGIGSGNAFQMLMSTIDNRPMVANIPAVTLASDGDRISYRITMRISETPIDASDGGLFSVSNAYRVRFGLYNSAGTPITQDGADPSQVDDDAGYLVRIDYAPADGNTLAIVGDPAGSMLGGASVSMSGTSSDPSLVIGNDPVELEMILTRNGDNIDGNVLFNGESVRTGVADFATDIQPNGLPYTFDTVAFGINGASLDYRVDDIQVVFTPGGGSGPLPAFDGFEDADWDNDGAPDAGGTVNDIFDAGLPWTQATGTSSFDILLFDDSGAGGIGTGNALNPFSFTTSTRVMAAPIEPVTLSGVGDRVVFGMDFRMLFIEASDAGRFRFGIHDDGGTPSTVDDADASDDDTGYMVLLDTGPSSATTARVVGNRPGGLLAGSTRSISSTSLPEFSINDTDPHRAEIVVTRVFDDTLGADVNLVEYYFDGELVTGGLDTTEGAAVNTFGFNQIAVGTSGLAFLDYVIDNVTISSGRDLPELPGFDGFEDGDRDNDGTAEGPVNDPADAGLAWYASTGTSDFARGVVDDGAGIGTGNALFGLASTTSTRVLSARINEVELVDDGDFVSLRFDVRAAGVVPQDDTARFRFGIHNNGGTPVTEDGSGSFDNDFGYAVLVDTGPSADSTVSVRRNPVESGLLSGSLPGIGATSNDPRFALADNTPKTYELIITRRFDADLGVFVNDASLVVDGIPATDGVDGDPVTPPVTSTFNQVSIGTNSLVGLEWRVDNVRIVTNTVDCDADYNNDGVANFFDVIAYGLLFDAGDMAADLTGDGTLDSNDYLELFVLIETGCG